MPSEVRLASGVAEYMGDGAIAVLQPSDQGPQSVILTRQDLKQLLRAMG